MFKKLFNLNSLSTHLLYISILIFIIAFNFSDNPTGGWQQQFMPNLNGQPLSDIIFLDSLNGFAITDNDFANDTGYILKTINGGDNWSIVFDDNRDFKEIQFINLNIGYVCGAKPLSGSRLLKTTNSGLNWFDVHPPDPALVLDDISVLNEDTIWVVGKSSSTGGVFRTTNGGINWTQQFSGNPNPEKVYMFNKDIGFISAGSNLLKTTDSGISWILIPGAGNFLDINFSEILTGWKVKYSKEEVTMQKSTDGGLNWNNQILPEGGNILTSGITDFSNVNRDTIWGVGGNVFYGSGQFRGIIYKTSNGGTNWLYQIPDTSIHIGIYFNASFISNLTGWCYNRSLGGIHTRVGGDTLFTKIKEINTHTGENYKLNQNYPNPFNPNTIINYELRITNYVEIKVYNVSGIEVKVLVKERQNSGNYTIQFDGSGLPSGIYFYSLFLDGERVDTKKMVLVR